MHKFFLVFQFPVRKSIVLWCSAVAALLVLVGCGTTTIGPSGNGTTTPAPSGNTQTVAFVDTGGSSTELQMNDGSTVLNFAGPAHGLLSPIVNGRVYVAFEAHMLPENTPRTVWAVDAHSGAILWTHITGPGLSTAPVVGNGTVYVGSDLGDIYALDAMTGAQRWHQQLTIGTSGAAIPELLRLDATTVYFLTLDHVYAYDAQTGTPRWTASVGGSAISITAGSVLVEDTQNGLSALAVATGTQQWKQTALVSNLGSGASLVVTGDNVYASPDGTHLLKVRISDGTVQATITADDFIFSVTADANTLYVATVSSLRAYGLTDNALHWYAALGKVTELASLPGTLVTLTWDGDSSATTQGVYITALRTTDGGQIWRTHVQGTHGYDLQLGTVTTSSTPPPPPTALVPPTNCGNDFDIVDTKVYQHAPVYITYYDPPNGVYPGIAYPPFTRTKGNSGTGTVETDMCSTGTSASILAFMTTQFTNAGWHQVTNNGYCVYTTCWQSPTAPNPNYVESWQINSDNLWSLSHHNPHV